MIYDRTTTLFVHCFLLEDVTLGEFELHALPSAIIVRLFFIFHLLL
jgi:hypothetical protein